MVEVWSDFLDTEVDVSGCMTNWKDFDLKSQGRNFEGFLKNMWLKCVQSCFWIELFLNRTTPWKSNMDTWNMYILSNIRLKNFGGACLSAKNI